MSSSAYAILWSTYLVSALGCLLFGWLVIRRLLGWVTLPLLLPVAVLMLIPARVEEGGELFAPAFIVAVFDELSGAAGGWTRAGVYLVIGLLGAVIVSFAWLLAGVWQRWRKRGSARQTE